MIDPAGIPVVQGDPEKLAEHALELETAGTAFADTGARVHGGWQALAPVYAAPEASQLMASTGPVQQVSASVGEDIAQVGRALGAYAGELRQIRARLDALRADAHALVADVGEGEPDEGQADRSNELLAAVNVAVADFDDAQRRCANTINALYGGTVYRADDGDGVVALDEFGATAAALDAAAAGGGVAWGGMAEAEDGNLLADIGHGALDLIGLVPVIGEAADVANAGWYAIEGDYLNAGLSLAGAIPIAGWVATGSKVAIKGVSSLDGARRFYSGRPTMVPSGATEVPFQAFGNFTAGEKFRWQAPGVQGPQTRFEYWAHGPDPSAPPGSNASRGPIFRITEGTGNQRVYHDGAGNTHRPNAFNANSPHHVPTAANDTHVPYPADQPRPDLDWHPAFVPNVAPLVPDLAGEPG